MIRAAGILLISKTGNALFLKRGPGSDMPGLWCVPGGRLEDGETPIAAAVRETEEESGFKANPKDLKAWSRTVSPRETTGANPTPPPGTSILPQPVAVDPVAGMAILDGEEVEFTTFVAQGVDEFIPDIAKSGEHVAYAWAPVSQPPEPLHPGVALSLGKFGMHELDIAKQIAAGTFASPQRYENLWLFALRITGTGMAYRRAHDEYVWRDGSLYLTQDFLDRCAGLPVIWEHPEGNVLNAKEYRERSIGAVMFAYIKPDPEGRGNDDVWAIARINDTEAAEEMDKGSSTSPAVVWRDASVNSELNIDGNKFLIEGKPSLLDHIAICPAGVWDKGRTPTGVSTSRGDNDMDIKELEKILADEAKKRADEVKGTQASIDAMMAGLKSVADSVGAVAKRLDSEDEKKRDDAAKRRDGFKFGKRGDAEEDDKRKDRMDAEEKAYCDACMEAGDSEEEAKKKAADKRKDADEEDKNETEKEKADKARKDEEEAMKKEADSKADSVKRFDALEKELAELRGRTKPMEVADINAMTRIQSRSDAIEMNYGRRARAPLLGESVLAYTRHWANEFKQYDARYKGKDLTAISADADMFPVVVEDIFKSAENASRNPTRGERGQLIPVTRRSDSGHTIIEYHGDTSPWMNRFAGPVRQFAKKWRDKDDSRRN